MRITASYTVTAVRFLNQLKGLHSDSHISAS